MRRRILVTAWWVVIWPTAPAFAADTLVIVTSDHGMPFPRLKGHAFDMAHRVPLVAYWPKGIVRRGLREAALLSAIDLAETDVRS